MAMVSYAFNPGPERGRKLPTWTGFHDIRSKRNPAGIIAPHAQAWGRRV